MDSLARGYVQQGLKQGIQQTKISDILSLINYGISKELPFEVLKADELIRKEVLENLKDN